MEKIVKKLTKRYVILGSIFYFLGGCATPYQSGGFRGGYSDMALNQDTYIIGFRGNGYTSAETVQSYVLRRSAELTLQKGYKYFLIENGGTTVNRQVGQTPATIQTHSNGNFQGNGYGYDNGYSRNYNFSGYGNSDTYTTVTPSREYEMDRYKSMVTVKMLHNNKDYPQAYDAAIILGNYQQQ
jgi:hypothetical protein